PLFASHMKVAIEALRRAFATDGDERWS
ncbi:hypothetical protein ACEP3G_22330, partial [Pseudomonas aeruginosa]